MNLRSVSASRYVFAALLVGGLLMALRPLAPHAGPENWFQGADLLFHLVYFALLLYLGVYARLMSVWSLGLGLLLFGVGIERAQSAFTETRSASFADVLADTAGLLLGVAMARLTSARQPEEDRR